jgi:hypothetical protein
MLTERMRANHFAIYLQVFTLVKLAANPVFVSTRFTLVPLRREVCSV